MSKLALISKALRELANRIDNDNTHFTEEEQNEILDTLKKLDKEQPLSKYQAYTYLGVSRATFDNLVKEGKIPHGKKQQGFNELQWFQKDLDKYIKEYGSNT